MTLPSLSALAWSALYAALAASGAYFLVMTLLLWREIFRSRARNAHAAAALVLRKELQKELYAYLAGGTTDASVRRYFRIRMPDGSSQMLAYYPREVRAQLRQFLDAYKAVLRPRAKLTDKVLQKVVFAIASVGTILNYTRPPS